MFLHLFLFIFTTMELQSLIAYIKHYLSTLYIVKEGKKDTHINYPDFGFIISIGDFKSVETFYIPEWTQYYENRTIDQELVKRTKFIEYKFTSAGYSHENGGKSKWNIK